MQFRRTLSKEPGLFHVAAHKFMGQGRERPLNQRVGRGARGRRREVVGRGGAGCDLLEILVQRVQGVLPGIALIRHKGLQNTQTHRLAMTPAERLANFTASSRDLGSMVRRARRIGD